MARGLMLLLLLVGSLQWTARCSDSNNFTYTNEPVPSTFYEGDQYPSRDEYTECQPIRLHVAPNTRRYHDMVSYYGDHVTFSSNNDRRMTSRLHSKLARLASRYYDLYGEVLHVLKAWTNFPDADLQNTSLHYEGRGIRIEVTAESGSRLLLLAVEYAGFDWVKWYSGYAYFCVIPDVCDVTVDLAFILDQSGSVGFYNNLLAVQFISDVVDFFEIAPNATQVSFITYSNFATVHFDLDDFHSKSEIQNRITSVSYPGGYTLTALGLFQAGVILNPNEQRGARPLDEGIPRIAVLITDGKSNTLPIEDVANSLRGTGVQVYTVGVANYNLDELRFIASDPDRLHVFLLDSFSDAENFVDFLSYTACEAPAIVEPGTNTTTEVTEDSFRFFQTECTAFSVEIMIEQIDLEGKCSLYASTTKANPGPLDSTEDVQRNEDHSSDRRSLHLIIKNKLKYLIYVSVRGLWAKNRFSIIIWDRLFTRDKFKAFAPAGQSNIPIFNLNNELTVNETFLYKISKGPADKFSIDPVTGILSVLQLLSVGSVFELLVVAENVNASCHRGRITIEVCVVEQNLTFPTPPPANVSEDAPVDTLISNMVEATGGAGNIVYSIISGNIGNVFTILDQNTGDVTVAMATLDFETTPTYMLVIQATSQPGGDTQSAILTVNVVDVNEPPMFQTPCAINNSCMFDVEEESASLSFTESIIAVDPDTSSPAFSMLSYSIIPVTPSMAPFVINDSGVLSLSPGVTLDRETQDMYEFIVMVTDGMFSISTNVMVTVLDINDNAPVVAGPTRIDLLETAPVNITLLTYGATDPDIGVNAEIMFSLANGSPLPLPVTIDNNGNLKLILPVDFEDMSRRSFTFDVVASNPDGLSGSITVTLEVINVNDNAPQFSQSSYTATVEEGSALNTSVVDVEATDADGDVVSYSIVSGNIGGAFDIVSLPPGTSATIVVDGVIDRETVASYQLVVLASDGTNTDIADVFITVLDINDNAPMFSQDIYSFNIPEDVTNFTSLITATDADDPLTPNGQLTYSISINDTFTIDPASGDFSLVSTLDFETQSFYNITATVMDGGGLSDTALILVTVININEHAPVIMANDAVDVFENEPIGFEVAEVVATDLDQMDVTFTLTTTSTGLFAINTTTGIITLVGMLDFETQTMHELIVVASDGVLSTSADITVNVLDYNEHPPVIDPLPPLSFPEELPVGTVVAVVTATDQDSANIISLSILPNDPALIDAFNIDSASGNITVARRLDRETTPLTNGTITVMATDNGLVPGPRETAILITITLEDINDNAPEFVMSSYSVEVLEHASNGTPVVTVLATDADAGINALVTYTLVAQDNLPFAIDGTTGTITVYGTLDREVQDSYALTVTARDSGTPSLATNVTVNVQVLDINDNAPVLDADCYSVFVPENTPISTSLFSVLATDSDEGVNAEIDYSILDNLLCPSALPQCFFNIDASNGSIFLGQSLDFETDPTLLEFVIQATDRGIPSLFDRANITITIVNVDEAPPTFDDPNCDATVLEDAAINSTVTSCTATDTDFVSSGTISYSIVQYNPGSTDDAFTIDDDGNIILVEELDRETMDTYFLVVTATDEAGLSTTQTATITVGDVNDNAPVFQNTPYSLVLSDAALLQSNRDVLPMLNVSATDRDIGSNGQVVYTIDQFQINNTVTLITIIASDGGDTPLSVTTVATINFQSFCLEQNYMIDSNTGLITSLLLCGIAITVPHSTDVVLGSDIMLMCTVTRVTNDDVMVTFLRGTSIIGESALAVGMETATHVVDDATELDSGGYDCLAEATNIGTIQTTDEVIINVIIPAAITVGPTDVVLSIVGGQALLSLVCTATGTLPITFTWTTPQGDAANDSMVTTNVNDNQATLIIVAITNLDYQGMFTCTATNAGGSDTATAFVTIIANVDAAIVISLAVEDPDPPNNCNSFNSDRFDMVMSDITGQSVHITEVGGEGVCPPTPCSPNPCANGAICNLANNNSFTCECVGGYTGRLCETDIDECAGTACIRGTCVNVAGSYMCECGAQYYGNQCQYNCTIDQPCATGYICQSNEGAHVCVADGTTGGLLIQSPTQSVAVMNQVVNSISENLNLTGNRRKRNSNIQYGCVGEFRSQASDPSSYYLVWVCPDASQQTPSQSDLEEICRELVRLQLASICTTPQGFEASLNVVPPSNVEVELVVIGSNGIMPAQDVLDLLASTGALDQLLQLGYNVTSVAAVRPSTGSIKTHSSTAMAGGIAGGIVAGLILVSVIAIAIIILINRRRQKRFLVPTNDIVMSDMEEPRYAKVNKHKSIVLTNEPVNESLPYGLFDDDACITGKAAAPPTATPTVVSKATPTKRRSIKQAIQHKLEKTESSENLLEDGEHDSSTRTSSATPSQNPAIEDEPIYGNMNFKWEENTAGERWENYWKTQTVARGSLNK